MKIPTHQAFESIPETWDDEKLAKNFSCGLSPHPDDPVRGWCKSVGEERNGIRCIATPNLSTLIGGDFDAVLVDEGHLICKLESQVTRSLIRLQPALKWILSATPIPNIVSDAFSLIGWLAVPDWYKGGKRNASWPYAREEIGKFNTTFLSEERDYTQEDMNQRANPRWRGKCTKKSPIISSPARLLKLLTPTLAFISKTACHPATVPCKVIDIRVPLGKEQARLYAHFLKRSNIPCANPLIRARKQIAYLRGITADPAGFQHGGPKVASNFNPKTVAILELTRDILSRGEQVVIVCARVGQTNEIAHRLRQAGIEFARVDSTISAAEHSAQSNRFKSSINNSPHGRAHGETLNETRAILPRGKQSTINNLPAQVPVMLMGIKCAKAFSFDECSNLITGSLEFSYGSLHQAKGRVWRVNSKRPVTVYSVLCSETIEESMFEILGNKQDAATICLHGRRIPREFRPVDMGEVLAETVSCFASEGRDEVECEEEWAALRTALEATKYAVAEPVEASSSSSSLVPRPRIAEPSLQPKLEIVPSSAVARAAVLRSGRVLLRRMDDRKLKIEDCRQITPATPLPARPINNQQSTINNQQSPNLLRFDPLIPIPSAPQELSIWQLRRLGRLGRLHPA